MVEGPVPATVDDLNEILRVADICFPRDKERGGMGARWPHVYVGTPDAMARFLLMREDGSIIAVAGYTDEKLCIEGRTMRVGSVTAVCTLPAHRGKGMMSTVMKALNVKMRDEGYAFAELGGRRFRYNHFGYELGTREINFSVRAEGLNSVDDPSGYAVERYEGGREHVRATFQINRAEGRGLERDLEKHRTLLGRFGWETFIALSDGRVRAYVSLTREAEGEKCRVFEFGGEPAGIHAILAHQVGQVGARELRVESPLGHPVNHILHGMSVGYSIVGKRMVKILDLAAVLEGFAGQMHARYRGAGCREMREWSVSIAGTGESVAVRLSPEEVCVQPGRAALHVELPELEMVRFLFGMEGHGGAVDVTAENGFLASILPLDFYVWSLEMA